MQCGKVVCVGLFLILLLNSCNDVSSQETPYELPVQLVGFPFIIASVRLTNFLKKLSYTLSPETYRSRNRRELNIDGPPVYNAKEVQDYIVNEYGADACIFERPCVHYAVRAATKPNAPLNWAQIFDQYSQSPEETKEYYLLSVFLGNVVASPKLCLQLAKLRGCPDVY